MLQDIREKSKGWLAYTIIGLIGFTFLIIGTGSFTLDKDKNIVAKVNDREIKLRDVEHYAERYLLSQGDEGRSLDPKWVKEMAVEALIQDYAMMDASESRGFIISKQQIIQAINEDPAFAQDGAFSPEKYTNLLSQNYFTDQEYRAYVASRFMYTQLQQGLILTNFALDDDLAVLFKYIDQSRDFEYAKIHYKDFIKQASVTETQIQDFYQNNQDNFLTPEQVKIQYLELKEETIRSSIEYSDEQLNKYYMDNIQVFTDPEKYKVAHILIEVDPSEDSNQEKAKEKVLAIKAKIDNGADFGVLAKEQSQDAMSAKKGGELLWLHKGQASIDPTFEEAAYKLEKVGDLSDPVLTKFGYHLIKLLEKEQASVAPFSEVKEKVISMYQSQKAQELLYDKADELISLAYEYSDSLDKAAEVLDLEVVTTDFFERSGGQTQVTKNPKVIQAAFSVDVIADGHNSELLEL